jgi:hypothetical protein
VLYTFNIYNIFLVLDTFTIKRIKYNMYNIYRPRSGCTSGFHSEFITGGIGGVGGKRDGKRERE